MAKHSKNRIYRVIRSNCLLLFFICFVMLKVAQPTHAASNLFIGRGDTLTNKTYGHVTARNTAQVSSEPLRLSCNSLPFAVDDILVIDQENHHCTLLDDLRGKLQPGLDNLVLSEDGRQTSASLRKILANGMLAYFDAAANVIVCTPPHQGLNCTQAVDTIPPVLYLPAPISTTTHDPAGLQLNYAVTASDNVDPNPLIICTPSSGSVFPIGTTNVVCTAKDAGGITVMGTFSVLVTQVMSLSASVTGSGTVIGTSSPYPDITCPDVCSADYPYGVNVLLTANPAWYSQFSGWTGCVSASNTCQIAMDNDKMVSAHFTMIPKPVIVFGDQSYDTLTHAVSSLSKDSSIMGRMSYNSSSFEPLLFNQGYTVNLNGGYSDLWTTTGETTNFIGSISISSGRVNVNGIKVRP